MPSLFHLRLLWCLFFVAFSAVLLSVSHHPILEIEMTRSKFVEFFSCRPDKTRIGTHHNIHSVNLPLHRLNNQVAFVDSSKDELSILAASVGEEVEHDVPGWRERLRLHRLELTVSTTPCAFLLLTALLS